MDHYVYQALVSLRAEPNDVINGFFSDSNIQIIQNNLKKNVKKNINVSIGNQSCHELYIAMLYIYRTYGKNQNVNSKREIDKLNEYTTHTLLPDLISNVLQYVNYIKDISSLPVPIKHGTNTSIKGTNSLKLQDFF